MYFHNELLGLSGCKENFLFADFDDFFDKWPDIMDEHRKTGMSCFFYICRFFRVSCCYLSRAGGSPFKGVRG